MRILILMVLLVASTSFMGQTLDAVRTSYIRVAESDEATSKFEQCLEATNQSTNVISAYKGALMTMQSRLVKGIKNKKALFKEGILLIENAVKKDPENLEIRTIRLSIQENSPKFLKYNTAIDEDKNYILSNYFNIASTNVGTFVKGYVAQSTVFTDEEKIRL